METLYRLIPTPSDGASISKRIILYSLCNIKLTPEMEEYLRIRSQITYATDLPENMKFSLEEGTEIIQRRDLKTARLELKKTQEQVIKDLDTVTLGEGLDSSDMDQTPLDVSDTPASGQDEPSSSEQATVPQPTRKARAPTEIFVLIADPETAIELETVRQAFIATDQLNIQQTRADQILECYAAKHIIDMLKDNVMPDMLNARQNVGLIDTVIGGILMESPSTRTEMSAAYIGIMARLPRVPFYTYNVIIPRERAVLPSERAVP